MLKTAAKNNATRVGSTRGKLAGCLLAAAVLGGCATPRTNSAMVYDFGPGALVQEPANRLAPLPALVLADVQSHQGLDSTAVLYRLIYSDLHVLQPYAHARWSMPPAQLLGQQLRSALGARRAVLSAQEGVLPPAGALVLRLELVEFSQLFETPQSSHALLRLRATLSQPSPGGEAWIAQRELVVRHPSVSADAAGGVRALAGAAAGAVEQLDQWVQQTQAALPPKP